jgi:hypothetical protein
MPTNINIPCPGCQRNADSHLDVFSGLGPTLLECPQCTRVFEGDRQEWGRMGGLSRLWFVVFSLLAVAVASAVIGFGSGFAFTAGKTRQMEVSAPEWLIVWPTLAAWAVVLTSIQVYRLACSVRRGTQDPPAPFPATLWNLQLSMQIKALSVGMAWFAVCALLGLILGR